MIKKFQENLLNHNLLDSTKRVLLAVSGGVDSVVLLDLMTKIPLDQRPQISIAHLNHQLRSESASEEKFVGQLAEKYKVDFYSQRWKKEEQTDTGIELAAREQRYNFFKEVMEDQVIPYLMTGHHLDDQVETILMRLTRGASLEQLLGIQSEQKILIGEEEGYLIRPLLEFSKEEIYQYARNQQLSYLEDESNKGLDYTRNRFRNEIIPLLKQENTQFNQHVKQFTLDLTDLIEISKVPINAAYKELVIETDDQIQMNIDRLLKYSHAMRKALITAVLEKLYDGMKDQYKTNYIELINRWLIEGDVNSSLDLTAGYSVKKNYNQLIFKKRKNEPEIMVQQSYKIEKINQWVQLSDTEKIGLFLNDQKGKQETKHTIKELNISEDSLHLPLTIRHRKPGDRMTYQGLQGSKKIKDIFIDDKTPRKDRDKIWLVEDNQKQIIWLLSHRKMDLFTGLETDKLFYSLKYIKK